MRVWTVERGDGYTIAICANAEKALSLARGMLKTDGADHREWTPSGVYEEGELDFLTSDGFTLLLMVRSTAVLD